MTTTPSTFGTAARRLVALALGLWLSGAGCLACCEGAGRASAHGRDAQALRASAHERPAAVREAERAAPAASSAGHSCCKARVGTLARAGARAAKEASAAAGAEQAPTTEEGVTSRTAAADNEDTEAAETAEGGPPEARRRTVPGRACCRRILRAAEQARKARVEPAPAHAPSTMAPPAQTSPARRHAFASARTRAPDRGSTYLLCRSLLI